MRLLFLTSRLPYPPNRGDRLRVFNFIRRLSTQHEIHLVSFISKKSEGKYIPSLKEYCQEIHTLPWSATQSALTVGLNIWRKQPLQTLYYRSAKMKTLVDQVIERVNFDVLYVHLFRMAPYVSAYNDHYRIADLTDVISQELIHSMLYRGIGSRLLYALERPRIERFERFVATHFEETWLISEYDRTFLAADCPDANIQVIRNGVDTQILFPTGEVEIPNSLILVGHMGVFHNVDAATFLAYDILPRVRAEIPDAHLKIVGAAPNPQVQSLSRIPGVEIMGYVPDLNTALNSSAVFVAPLRFAAGVQNKVLEALAAGRPVVTSNLVNNGLGAQPDRDLLTADTPEEFSTAILNLLQDKSLRTRIGLAARHFVKGRYNWDMVAHRLENLQAILRKSRRNNFS